METITPDNEAQEPAFDTNLLLDGTQPLPNDDPMLKEWIEQNGQLYVNRAVIAVREAVPGEVVETWVNGPEGKVLERSATAESGQLVAVGVLGEQYIPSATSLGKNKVPVGADGLRGDEVAPPVPYDGHQYQLWRSNGQDYRLAATNPYNENIYLLTSSGRLQTGLPGGKIAAQVGRQEAEGGQVVPALDVARFIAPDEFAASYRPASAEDCEGFGLPPTAAVL